MKSHLSLSHTAKNRWHRGAWAVFKVALLWSVLMTGGHTPAEDLVTLRERTLSRGGQPFLGLGASYFQALRDARHDPIGLRRNLGVLATNGFNYVRVLSMVAWDGLEIAPVTFTNRPGRAIPAWDDYWRCLDQLLDACAEHDILAQITIFADAQQVMPSRATRRQHLQRLLDHLAGRESHLLCLEIANEAWQNGFPEKGGVLELREYTRFVAERCKVLVAITSNDDVSEAGIISLYEGSAADLATVHFSRDRRTSERGWLPVRDAYRAALLPGVPPVLSNEPIGPGSSVGSEEDPLLLCSAAMFAYLAGLPGYVYHDRTGIYGYEKCCPPGGARLHFESTVGIHAFRHVRTLLPPDVPNWRRNDGLESEAPFTVYCAGSPDRYWPDVPGARDGCVRNTGAAQGQEFICLPIGIQPDGLFLQARKAVRFQVYHPLTGARLTGGSLAAGERVHLPADPGAYLIKGTWPSSE